MPKLKQPETLEDLAIKTLGSYVVYVSKCAIWDLHQGETPEINVTGLQKLLYGDIPPIQSRKITIHVCSGIREALEKLKNFENNDRQSEDMDVKSIKESIVLGSVCPQANILDMSILPLYAKKLLCFNLYRLKKLKTLIVTDLPDDSIALLPNALIYLKFLVVFQMRLQCTDAIINALCSETIELIDVSGSKNVTNACFWTLSKFNKLTHLLISGTSITTEGLYYVQSILQYEKSDETGKGFIPVTAEGLHDVRIIQECEKSDDPGKGFLHFSFGSPTWEISSLGLNLIAITCPRLKQLEIANLDGDLETIGNLTKLQELKIGSCNFQKCNLEGFLRLRGSNLTTLKLTTKDQIDLISIMNHCINLKELILFNSKIMLADVAHIEAVANVFQNLEIFDIRYGFSTSLLEDILCTCINIKRLHLTTNSNNVQTITDGFILRLLARNPMKNLTRFSISSSSLSMISVNALIEQCPLLDTLEKLSSWKRVTDAEVKTLRQEIKEKNQDLRVN